MPITQKQAKENQDLYNAAMADPIKVKITGKYLNKNEDGEFEPTGGDVPPKKLKGIVLGWMGTEYRPDENGIITMPRPAFEFHNRAIRTNPSNVDKYEMLTLEDHLAAEAAKADEEGDGADAAKPLYKMTKDELVAFGVSKGLKADDLESQTVPALRDLLKD